MTIDRAEARRTIESLNAVGSQVDRVVRPLMDKRGDICTLALYEALADLANEAGAVDTVIGRPRALYERLCSLRDTVGAAKASAAPLTLPAEWLVKVRRLVQGFEHVSGIARLWEPDYSSGSERALWSRATEACADVAKLLREAEGPNVGAKLETTAAPK